MKSIFKICLIITLIILLLSIATLQINMYLDTYYKGIGALVNVVAYYSLIFSFYSLLSLLGYKTFAFIRNLLKK